MQNTTRNPGTRRTQSVRHLRTAPPAGPLALRPVWAGVIFRNAACSACFSGVAARPGTKPHLRYFILRRRRKARTWVSPRRTPVCAVITAWACAQVAGGCWRKCASKLAACGCRLFGRPA